jgi:hypothetical protein
MPLNFPLVSGSWPSGPGGTGAWYDPIIDIGAGFLEGWLGGGNGGNGGNGGAVPRLGPGGGGGMLPATVQAAEAMVSPWSVGRDGKATPQVHIAANPVSGKLQWFHPAAPTGWKLTHRKGRRRHPHTHHTHRRTCRKR